MSLMSSLNGVGLSRKFSTTSDVRYGCPLSFGLFKRVTIREIFPTSYEHSKIDFFLDDSLFHLELALVGIETHVIGVTTFWMT